MVKDEAKDWYSYSEIRFSREHIIWAIQHLEDAVSWPPDFKVSGYTGKKRGGLNKRASFDNVKVIIGEIKYRLAFTKTDGKLLKSEIQRITAQGGTVDFEDLEPEAQNALNFLSLWDFRKRPRYYEWKKWRKYYFKQKLLPKGSKNNRKAGSR